MPSSRIPHVRVVLHSIMILGSATALMAQTQPPTPVTGKYAIALHGGAIGNLAGVNADQRRLQRESLRVALAAGVKILEDGGSSLDAVEQVVRHLEDDPLFNAGRGAVLNERGEHELDASIMDGRDLACGAVASVRTVQNPISLARKVMAETPHVLLAGDGAEQFADAMGVVRQPLKFFRTPARLEEWRRHQEPPRATPADNKDTSNRPRDTLNPGASSRGLGTVGCVALDRHGNLAAGTSTGGLLNKRFGRIGDSPLVGAGTYADNATCAVSCTGRGEEFIRRAAAYDVAALMAYRQLSVAEAVRVVVFEKLPKGSGAMIAVGRDGSLTSQFNTQGLSHGMADSSGRFEVHVGD
jgi:L-asparaginase / beta-aspartyl-peptidase